MFEKIIDNTSNIIVGKSVQNKTDLVVIDSGMRDVESFRSSWREGNF